MSEEVASLFASLGLHVNAEEWNRGDKIIDNMKKAAGALAGVFAVREIGEWVGQTIEAGDQATKMAQKLGISAESVQELKYAAEQSGTSIDALSHAIFHLDHGLSTELKAGTGDAIDAFKSMGISTEFLKGKMSGPGGVDDILAVTADKFSKMEDGSKKTALAMAIFGKSGADLIPFLNAGAGGIEALRGEANDLGLVIDGKSAKGMEAFGDDVDRIKKSFAGVRNEIVTAALPALQEAATWLLGVLKDAVAWVKDHREEIAAFFHALGATIKFVAHVIYEAFVVAGAIITGIVSIISGVVDAIVAIGKFIYDVVIVPIGEFFARVVVGAKVFMNGVIAVVMFAKDKVVGFFSAIYDAGKRTVEFIVGVAGDIKDAFASAFNFIADLPVIKQLRNLVTDLQHLKGSTTEGDAYDEYINNSSNEGVGMRGNFAGTLSREEFETQRAKNVAARVQEAQQATANGGPEVGGSTSSSSSTVINQVDIGGIHVTAPPGADANAIGRVVDSKIRDAFQEHMDTHLSNAKASVQNTKRGD